MCHGQGNDAQQEGPHAGQEPAIRDVCLSGAVQAGPCGNPSTRGLNRSKKCGVSQGPAEVFSETPSTT